MKTLIGLIVLAIIAKLIFEALKRGKATERREDGAGIRAAPCFKKDLLTEPEQVLYHRIRNAFPDDVLLAQVSLSALVGIKKNPQWQAQFNAISRKYVDFVLCDRSFNVITVIELDDKTHERYDRWKSDDVKNVAFRTAGIRVVRFKANNMPGIEQIREAVAE